ncbi:ThuA domain-containing protein [Sphingomonas oryzagri]
MRRLFLLLAATLAFVIPAAARAEDQFRLLVVAISSKYHYEFIPIARDSLVRMARQNSFGLVWADKPDVFDGDLRQYAAVMFLNTPAEQLSPAERRNFESYLRAGGSAIVVHRAAIIPPGVWPWYEQLVGRKVGTHPMLQTGVVTVADPGFPATFGVPDRWVWSDEFYPTTNPYHVNIQSVLDVDERSYDPTKIWPGQTADRMGKDHPVAWYHRFENGRVFVTTLGHNGDDYSDPVYLRHLFGGIYWAATGLGQRR